MSTAGSAIDAELQQRVSTLQQELQVAKQKEEDITQERDFYFSKLREIELLCQQAGVKEEWGIMVGVEAILYAATEEDGTKAREDALPTDMKNGAA